MQKMINFAYITKENRKKHYSNWPKISDHSYRVLIAAGSGSGKKSFFNLISHQSDIEKIYLYAKDTYEAKHQLLINEKILTASILTIPKALII